MKELIIDSQIDKLGDVLAFIETELQTYDVVLKVQHQVNIVAEEIYVNIAHYAYRPEIGLVAVRVDVTDRDIALEFEDGGRRYNPLEHENPDIKLSSDDREIGGLGIFLVKKMTDGLAYRYENSKNILTIKKRR
jgi:anti-sigma regulatory factor (Ser/Thr protein kinase)